jgi:OOP family OmpA-OmpF porin
MPRIASQRLRRFVILRNTLMNPSEALRLAGIAGLASLLAAPAFSQQDPNYFYGGASVGQSRAKIDDARITADLLSQGFVTSAMTNDESSVAYKVFGGYQFNRYVGVEGGYFNLGRFAFKSTTAPAGTLDGKIRLHGINLDLVGTLPMTERLSAIARVGAQHASAHDDFAGSGAVIVLAANPRKSETNYKFGAGLQYAFTPNLMMRGEAERYRINDAVGNHGDVNLFSVGLVFAFGRGGQSAPVAMAAPAVEPAAVPEPVVAVAAPPAAVAPPPPPPRRVSFASDTLFAFDRSVLGVQGEAALNRFVQELGGMQFDRIVVEGHTDRLGSQAYNQKLSERRAQAVKDYLVTRGGVDSARITAVGKSESEPVTKAGDCPGTKPSPALIACLQPDRRVDVEVTGTATP